MREAGHPNAQPCCDALRRSRDLLTQDRKLPSNWVPPGRRRVASQGKPAGRVSIGETSRSQPLCDATSIKAMLACLMVHPNAAALRAEIDRPSDLVPVVEVSPRRACVIDAPPVTRRRRFWRLARKCWTLRFTSQCCIFSASRSLAATPDPQHPNSKDADTLNNPTRLNFSRC